MEEPESYSVDCEDVQEQIEQQRELAAQLREKLEQEELQLASKEQQNELLKSKLSLLKSRTRSKRSLSTNEKDEKKTKLSNEQSGSPKNPGKKPTSNSATKGKINILREQLEQNRLRFEKHGLELSEDTRSMEAMVEQLRHELEERDVTIQELQAGQEPLFTPNPEVQIPQPRDLASQLLDKEQEIITLSTHVTELQNTILELQENLKEKDCVIEARTQAISLLSEDMSRKWRSNVDMLEETRQQMQMMQENFVRIEAGLNAEIEQLNTQLQNNSKKLSQAEQNVKDAETARNDLVFKNEELLTELKKLQEKPKTSTGLEEANSKVKELSEALTEANKLTVKLKAEHKAKIKTLNKQIDSLRKESDLSGEMVQLQNHIAELEEEKGNLQLLLLDIEESTAIQEHKINELQTQILELQNQKFEAEMKLVEWEEQKSSNGSVEQEVAELKLKLEAKELEIKNLQETISSREHSSTNEITLVLEKQLEEAQSAIKEWQNRFEDLEKEHSMTVSTQHEKSVVVEEEQASHVLSRFEEKLKHKVDVLEHSVLEKQAQVLELQAIVQSSLEKVEGFSLSTVTDKGCENCISLTNQLQEQEAQLTALESSLKTLENENESLKIESKQAALSITKVQKDEHPVPSEAVSNLQRQLIEVSGELELKREECDRLESKLKVQVEKAKKLAVNLKVKTVACKDLEEKASKYESILQSSKVECDQLLREKQDILEKWQLEVSEKDTNLSQATEALASKELEVLNLTEELNSKTSALAKMQFEFEALQSQAEKLQLLADERLLILDNLSQSNTEQEKEEENTRFAELQTELASIKEQLNSENEEKQAAVTKLENFTKQAKIKLAKEKKLRLDLLQKQEELEALVTEKNAALEEVQNKHAIANEYYQQEQARFEKLLKEQHEQIAVLHQQLEQEVNKLQYANESVNTEEVIEETQDLLSAESFQNEIENLFASAIYSSPVDALPLLQDEKTKTMSELGSSFDSLHCQIVALLQNRPDVNAGRKLLAELKNLITRVINRTAALESKIKSIMLESDSLIQKKLLDAERSVQVLENSLSEAAVSLGEMEEEKLKLENEVNNLNRERWDLSEKVQEEGKKVSGLETMLNESYGQVNSLVQNTSLLQDQINEKDGVIQDLQTKYQSTIDQYNAIHQEYNIVNQDNLGLKSNLENLNVDNETLKSKLLAAEQELSNIKLACVELQTTCDKTNQKCELLQRQLDETSQQSVDIQTQLQKTVEDKDELQLQLANVQHQLNESSQQYTELQFQLQKSLQEKEELHHQLEDAVNSISRLQQELLTKTEIHSSIHPGNSDSPPDAILSTTSEKEEALRQQLSEKTAEIENYQRRLIQLQMGAPDPGLISVFGHHSEKGQVTAGFQAPEKELYQGSVFSDQNNSSQSTAILDAFKPAASFFETSPEQNNELKFQIKNLTEQLESSVAEKKSLELQLLSLQNTLDTTSSELKAAKEEVESMRPTLSNLQSQVSELTVALEASQAHLDQEKENVKKLEISLEKMKSKLETTRFEKEEAECELEIRAQKEAEERPDIPQTLDTHVSSLQDSGSGFNEDGLQTYTDKTDESVMESNITQLESELRGMVMSQQENLLKQKTMEGCWDSKSKKVRQPESADVLEEGDEKGTKDESAVELGSLKSEVSELKEKIIQLESENIRALSQIDELQTELQKYSQSNSQQSTDQTVLSVPDSLINEDDSWGWGADSAHLEVQHQQLKSQIEPMSEDLSNKLQNKIESLQSENESLVKEKTQLAEDLKASQIRAAKLTRKLRDLKTKYDEVSDRSRSTESPFDSLDQAIEEERMKQIQGLEKELKEVQAELNAFKAERDRLQKQVEVFSSANERMLEIKERQDVEVEMWQKRSKDLTNQVQAMEWKIRELEDAKEEKADDPTSNLSPSKPSPPSELNSLEVEQLLKENHTWNSNYENLMQEYQKLRAQCLSDSEQRTQIDALVTQQKGMIERLEHEKTYFQDVYDSLKMDYEAACAQLASKQVSQDDSTHLLSKRCEELEEKLMSAEQRLHETAAELQAVSSDNAEFQAQCSQLNDARKELLLELEQSQSKLEADALEISKLHENIRVLEENSHKERALTKSSSIPVSVQEEIIQRESITLNSTPSSSILNWDSVVPGVEQQSADIFESIASNSTQALEEKLLQKDNEMQKDKRMIETLKRTMEESGQEWSQLIEYHKNQLEVAQTTINELQNQLVALKQENVTENDSQDSELVYSQQAEKLHELQSILLTKDKEIEALQINLSLSEESKKKLEDELNFKKAQVEKLMSDISRWSANQMSQPGAQASAFAPVPMVLPINVPVMSSVDKNVSNELDLALCMLHERDVRCEELTLELTQLLEERDGLQLRLSNAIRTNEELRERLKQLLSNQSGDLNLSSTSITQRVEEALPSFSAENSNNAPPLTFSPIVNPEAYTVDLQNKLTEIRKIGYSHDKRLKEDSEYRHQQQMRLMSPSPTSALSGNASEAASVSNEASPGTQADSLSNNDLNNAEQSSSNDSQGSILGWLWGRS